MLVPRELVHLHVCVDAVWKVSGPQALQYDMDSGTDAYRKLKAAFNEVMLVNEVKVRQWIRETAKACVPVAHVGRKTS